ncbi:hypothetical protein, partial [Comamonas aquatica]|uniref:hypothetical protein n=1 Tax=Comamonas aquatica TaxID=225991 RepID=UPI0028D3AC6D
RLRWKNRGLVGHFWMEINTHSMGKLCSSVVVRVLSNGGTNPVSLRGLGWVAGAGQRQPSKKSSYIRPYIVGNNKAPLLKT